MQFFMGAFKALGPDGGDSEGVGYRLDEVRR